MSAWPAASPSLWWGQGDDGRGVERYREAVGENEEGRQMEAVRQMEGGTKAKVGR